MHGLHGLPRAVVDQTGQVPTGPIAMHPPARTLGQLVGEFAEALQTARASCSSTSAIVENSSDWYKYEFLDQSYESLNLTK